MNNTKKLMIGLLLAIAVNASGQKIVNGDFDAYNLVDPATFYSVETELGAVAINQTDIVPEWFISGEVSIVTVDNGTHISPGLHLAGSETGGVSKFGRTINITEAGLYNLSFTTYADSLEQELSSSRALVVLSGGGENLIAVSFSEEIDQKVTSRSFIFEVSEELLEKSGGRFDLYFTYDVDPSDGRRNGIIFDDIAITPFKKPDSGPPTLLGLGVLTFAVLRKR
ncbi:MAG: hypothetical protein ACSHX6_04020 [Akkermansiaceae bacterium]